MRTLVCISLALYHLPAVLPLALVPSVNPSRRALLVGITLAPLPSLASPSLCSSLPAPTPDCLGAVDGLLADCSGPACISSQDDRPGIFSAPWQIEGSSKNVLDKLLVACQSRKDFSKVLDYDPEAEYLRGEVSASANSAALSNAVDTSFFVTRFAWRSTICRWRCRIPEDEGR